ncbi:MAG: hypothetical protein COA36_11765 [Desulfotalea sp.]|nr:MAG: hypothetical protein COA36_11765 [Desulfotalea sp.]
MPILKEDIKLMSSERLDDTDDGGGRMTGVEIQDGNVNNMFSDISRLDRTKGRTSMRKGFVGAFTDNQDNYFGVHVILTDPTADPRVKVCMFTTDNPYDNRVGARDRIESYVTQGTRYNGYLWGRHIAGARAIVIVTNIGQKLPDVGSVLFIQQGDNKQYVRLTDVNSTATTFEDKGVLNVITCGISDPLRYDFTGYEPLDKDKTKASMLYNTVVADAARYYGVMRPTGPMKKGDVSISVDSIYTNLVPSAQGESPVVDVTAGSVPSSFIPGDNEEITLSTTVSIIAGTSLYLPIPAVPGSLRFSVGGHNYHTQGNKVIYENASEVVGTIDHGAGVIRFNDDMSTVVVNYGATITLKPAAGGLRIGNSKALPILLANRGYNYVTSLFPLPAPGSVIADYMVQGKWYRLTDDGNGVLRGLSGSGSVNYATGAVVITCGALPDAGTAVLFGWGAPIEYVARGGKDLATDFAIEHTVDDGTIEPGSLEIKYYLSAYGEVISKDDGNGNILPPKHTDYTVDVPGITGNIGTVIYGKGIVRFNPTITPSAGSIITIESKSAATTTEEITVTSGNNSFVLSQIPVKPGSLSMQMDFTGHGHTESITIVDDGHGNIIAPPNQKVLLSKPLGETLKEGSTSITPLPVAGTINYNTGRVFFYGDSEGVINWLEKEITTQTVTTGA